MIEFKKHILGNGLTVIAHRDDTTPMAAVNVLYKVGAKNESPDKTGFAHLFEHLMFGGSINIPSYDSPLQLVGGENNAFTNNDYTDYYIVLPKDNIETALWLESDRMLSLAFNEKSLEVQRKVVIEEFKQRYLNQPYGDLWLLMRPMVYEKHPYRWPTIGMTPDHISNATMEDVKAFFKKYYNPQNAILSVAADIGPDEVFRMAEKWFGGIPAGEKPVVELPAEPVQTEARRLEVDRPVPATAIVIAFHMGPRMSREYYVCDVMTDILACGNSSRLYQRLVKESGLFSSVNAYVTCDIDPGLIVFTGHLLPGVDASDAEKAIWKEIGDIKNVAVSDYELTKVRNKYESDMIFGELNVMNVAMNLGYYEMLGDAAILNTEVESHNSVTKEEIISAANKILTVENSSTLIYRSQNGN